MKKLLQGILLTCTVMAAPVMAQTVTYACQYVKSGGLIWENSVWKSTLFHPDSPFFLKTEDGLLAPESVTEVFGMDRDLSSPFAFECTQAAGTSLNQSCIDFLGHALSFSTTTMSGTVARLFAGTSPQRKAVKDTLSLAPFVCTEV